MNHPLQCRCGTIKGSVATPRGANNRAICYCKDCQAFAYVLGRADDVLDERGGSDVIQVLPKHVTFTQGADALACLRLTPKGLVRWYADCCRMPIGNTLATSQFSFVGLVHSCLGKENPSLTESFGPVRVWVYPESARGAPKPKASGMGTAVAWFIGTALKARLNGDYKRTPFFRPETGALVATPRVLSSDEHARVMESVRAAAA